MLDFRHEVASAMTAGHLHVSYIVIKTTVLFLKRHVSVQESLVDAKVSARQQCVYEGP